MKYKDRYLHRLYPTTKLLYLLLFAGLSLIAPGWKYSYALFLILSLLAGTGSGLPAFLNKVGKSILVLFPFIFILQPFFKPGSNVIFNVWIFSAKWEGVFYSLRLCGILLIVVSSFILFFQTTETKDFILSLELMGVSPKISYIVLSSLQMIPQIKKRSQVIMNAQQARGIETKGGVITRIKAFIPMLAPLIISSFSSIEEQALTLEARAFSAPCKKTNIHTVTRSKNDKALLITAWALMALAVAGRVTVWH